MTRILTIITLLFATPFLAGCAPTIHKSYTDGVVVRNYLGHHSNLPKKSCQKKGYADAKRISSGGVGLYTYRCVGGAKGALAKKQALEAAALAEKQALEAAALAKKQALAKLENRCIGFGYTRSTPQFNQCVADQQKLDQQAKAIEEANKLNEQRAEEARKRAAAAWEAQRRAQQGDALMALGLSIMNNGRASPQASHQEMPRAGTTGCFLKGSYVSGFNRICNYDCMGSGASHTIGAAEICPLNR